MELDSHSALPEFACVQVSLEGSKPHDSGARSGFGCHDEKFASPSVLPPERIRWNCCARPSTKPPFLNRLQVEEDLSWRLLRYAPRSWILRSFERPKRKMAEDKR